MPRTTDNQQLLFEEKILCDQTFNPSRAEKRGSGQQKLEQKQPVLHVANDQIRNTIRRNIELPIGLAAKLMIRDGQFHLMLRFAEGAIIDTLEKSGAIFEPTTRMPDLLLETLCAGG